jgi:hypothetical protein
MNRQRIRLPRKHKKTLTNAIAGRWPRRQSKAHRRFRQVARIMTEWLIFREHLGGYLAPKTRKILSNFPNLANLA